MSNRFVHFHVEEAAVAELPVATGTEQVQTEAVAPPAEQVAPPADAEAKS